MAIVNFLCENGGDFDNHLIFKVNKRKLTALHLAARFGYDGIVAAILEHAQRIGGTKRLMEFERSGGLLAIHDAARMGKNTVVELLFKQDAEMVLKADDDGWTPLFWALAGSKHIHSHEQIDANQRRRRKVTVETLLKYGKERQADMHASHTYATTSDKYGITPLHLACATNDVDLVKLLVGQDEAAIMQALKQQTTSSPPWYISWATNGMSSLIFAARAGALRVLKMLCEEYHLDISTRDADNRTAVHHACLFRNINVLNFCVRKVGAAQGSVAAESHARAGEASDSLHKLLLMKDKDERTCLHLACDTTSEDARGGLNEPTSGPSAPANSSVVSAVQVQVQAPKTNFLPSYVRQRSEPALSILHGSDACCAADAVDEESKIDENVKLGLFHAVVARLCEVGGANLCAQKDKDGRTALHLCALGGYVNRCQILLEKGGLELLNQKDREGKTCLDLASAKSKTEHDRFSQVLKCLKAQQ